MSPTDTVKRFIECINAHDVDAMCDLMTEDHTFIDSHGNTERSREHMRGAWREYLNWFPDFRISVEQTLADDDLVVILGRATGTYCVEGQMVETNHWRIPAAWQARVRDGLISLWQVYADNEPVFRIMESAKKETAN